MNYWVIVSTSLVYLAVIGTYSNPPQTNNGALTKAINPVTGILTTIQNIDPSNPLNSTIQFYLICYPMSLGLTILLTLMIIARLALHGRNMRKTIGTGPNASGLYSDIVTMFIESYSLYTISFVLWIALQYVGNPVRFFFSPVFAETQVRALLRFHIATEISGYFRLTMATNRLSPHTSSSYGLPIGGP